MINIFLMIIHALAIMGIFYILYEYFWDGLELMAWTFLGLICGWFWVMEVISVLDMIVDIGA